MVVVDESDVDGVYSACRRATLRRVSELSGDRSSVSMRGGLSSGLTKHFASTAARWRFELEGVSSLDQG